MQLGWVDFSKDDREKVLSVMNLLQEQGAVDEIGIGMIRDAFANLFFPGTSTVQTIAKYFLIVPYILKEATDGKYGSDISKILQRIDDEERNCGILLMQNCPKEDGIIGRRVLPNGWVTTKPSNIYWKGIRTFEICKQDLTIPELIRASIALQAQKKATFFGNKGSGKSDSEQDDNDAGRDIATQLFAVPDDYYSENNWRENLSVRLTTTESAFLRERIEKSTAGSLLAFILKNHIDVTEYGSFEAVYEDLKDLVPFNLSKKMKLAYDFNRLVYTARVRYNYILSNGQNEEAVSEWRYIEDNIQYMVSVDIDEVLKELNISNFRLRRFLTSFKNALIAGDADSADTILIEREIEIKTRSRAKLCRKEDFANDTWIGGRYLDYRFFSARRIITDIYQGEENVHAQDQ